ncbi:unnamed protein product, partial [Agarophyton chilense]
IDPGNDEKTSHDSQNLSGPDPSQFEPQKSDGLVAKRTSDTEHDKKLEENPLPDVTKEESVECKVTSNLESNCNEDAQGRSERMLDIAEKLETNETQDPAQEAFPKDSSVESP